MKSGSEYFCIAANICRTFYHKREKCEKASHLPNLWHGIEISPRGIVFTHATHPPTDIHNECSCLLVFHGISTFVVYLMPKTHREFIKSLSIPLLFQQYFYIKPHENKLLIIKKTYWILSLGIQTNSFCAPWLKVTYILQVAVTVVDGCDLKFKQLKFSVDVVESRT